MNSNINNVDSEHNYKDIEKHDLKESLVDNIYLFPINITDVKYNEDNILSEFTCLLCLNLVNNPLLLKCCDKLLCFCCIYTLLETKNKCPLCYFKIIIDSPNPLIIRLLNSFKIKCPLNSIINIIDIDCVNNALSKYSKELNSLRIGICNCEMNYNEFYNHIFNKCDIMKIIYMLVIDIKDIGLKLKTAKIIDCDFDKLSINNEDINKNIQNNINLMTKENKIDSINKLLFDNLKEGYMYCNKCMLIDSILKHKCNKRLKFTTNVISQKVLNKYILNNHNINVGKQYYSKLHHHSLYYTNFTKSLDNLNVDSWSCDYCLNSETNHIFTNSYRCNECNFDICTNCYIKSVINNTNTSYHNHPLKVKEEENNWTCDICNSDYYCKISMYCKICDFDVCIECYFE